MNYFEQLNAINVNEKTEKKNGLTYLSWAWAWGELKKLYPMSYYTIYESKDGWNYFTDGRTCWVKTGVTAVVPTIGDMTTEIEHIEYLPVMDYKNRSIPAEAVTSFDVNKAIQRSLTKAVARHGLGLYIYAGEDLPEQDMTDKRKEEEEFLSKSICAKCGMMIAPYIGKKGNEVSIEEHAKACKKKFGRTLCLECIKEETANA